MARGKKTCPSCKAEVGPRLAVCECGHEFAFKSGKKPGGRQTPRSVPVEKPFENLTEEPTEILGIDNRSALRSFIEQLEACESDSNRTGGCYSAFAHCRGDHTIQIEVYLPMRLE